MRLALVILAALPAACRVPDYSAVGTRCDAERPCPGALQCVLGTCRSSCPAVATPCRDGDPQCLSTLAGAGPPGFLDGPPDQALFRRPTRLLALGDGALVVADTGNHALRLVPLDGGAVSTLAGNGRCDEADSRSLCEPSGMALGPAGELYVVSRGADAVHRVEGGQATRIIGTGVPDVLVSPEGIARAGDTLIVTGGRECVLHFFALDGGPARTSTGAVVPPLGGCNAVIDGRDLTYVAEVAVSTDGGTAWFSDARSRLYSVPLSAGLPSGPARSLAGSWNGFSDGALATAEFFEPLQLSEGPSGLAVADVRNHRLRLIRPGVDVSTLAGDGTARLDDGDGGGLAFPNGVVEVGGAFYFTSPMDHRIRRLKDGRLEAVAGAPLPLQDGCAGEVPLAAPMGVAEAPDGTVYFTDALHHAVRLVTPEGHVATLAGNGTAGALDGVGAEARLDFPRGLKVRPDGKLVVVDSGSGLLRLVDPSTREVTTLAGAAHRPGFIRGGCQPDLTNPPSTAELCEPKHVALGPSGELYFTDVSEPGQGALGRLDADGGALAELRFDWFFPRGITSTPAGQLALADGANEDIRTFDRAGTLLGTLFDDRSCGDDRDHWEWGCEPADVAYLGDAPLGLFTGGATLRRRLPSGAFETLAGSPFTHALVDGRSGTALDHPTALAVGDGGVLFIADTGNNRLRRLSP